MASLVSTGRWFAAGLAVLLAGGVFGYCARGGVGSEALKQESARADSAAEQARGFHEALLERIAWDSERLAALRDSADREIRDARRDRETSEAVVAEAGASLDSTLASLPSPVRDTAEAQLAREREGWRGTVAALEREMEARVGILTEERDTFRDQVDECVAGLGECHVALESMTFNRDRWRSEAQKKGLNLGLFRVPKWVGYLGAAAAGVALGTRF